MSKQRATDNDPTEWLLEPNDAGVRYLAMRDLTETDSYELRVAEKRAHSEGTISQVLARMEKEGYWVQLNCC